MRSLSQFVIAAAALPRFVLLQKRPAAVAAVFFLLLAVPITSARAEITVTGLNTGSPATFRHSCPEPVTHNCVDSLWPGTLQHLTGPSQSCMTAFGRDFPTWAPTYNWTQPWNGTLNVSAYEAKNFAFNPTHDGCIPERQSDGTTIDGMGAFFEATYTPHVDDPNDPDDPPSDRISRFRWLQIIITSDPKDGATSPYVDPVPNDDTLPFYWTEGESPSGDFYFRDRPRRECPCFGQVDWRAELYLTDWYSVPGSPEDDHLIIYDGFAWGFQIQCFPEVSSIPEPSTYGTFGSILVIVLAIRRCSRARRHEVQMTRSKS